MRSSRALELACCPALNGCGAEHAANRVRANVNNPQLKLTDALMTFSDRTNAGNDRVYQRVLAGAPELQHSAVYSAFKTLVESCHHAHHEVLREVILQHPDVVFQNDTQRRAFDALCELVDLPVLSGTPAAAAAADA